ncbi:S1C family serine protease [Pseudonocardia nigra]|uniref:S1C family serine protease n=1 Tax=Pseudonocardia nigra TaxID=1921578 RepID=UPI001C5F1D1A|nr:trypsin-like peptidase domain-containing protein [Pseudonocardia nigra]
MTALRRGLLGTATAALLATTACTAETAAPVTEEPAGTASSVAAPTPLGGTATADVVARLAPSVVTVRTGQGGGSGVVYQPDVVITNHHVVAGSDEVTIDYADGTSSTGTVLATDPTTDIAVVRTARGDLPVPEYRTELPRPGEPVLAIGSPLGFEGTVTAGIVSALNRQIPGSIEQSRALVDLIQVDAAISPGNSGGALLDAQGRVIGINEAYIPPAAGAVSLGFAIPAATAVAIADQLLADGSATHPVLGLSLGRLTEQISSGLGVGTQDGALVLGVPEGGPAAAAGVQPGDVVIALGDREVGSIEDLLGALRETEPGQETTVTVLRGGEELDLPVTIGAESR